MNNTGQLGILFGIMLFLFAFIVASILTQPLKEFTDDVRGSTNLDCTNTTISTGQRATCLVVDLTLPMFIGSVIFVGLGSIFYFTSKTSE